MATDDPAKPTDPTKENEDADNVDKQNVKQAELLKMEEEETFQKKFDDEVKRRAEAAKVTKAKLDEEVSFAKAAEKAKANLKDKAEMQKFEKKMIGGEARFLCDKCDYNASSIRSVKMHWGKKHRRDMQEEEEAKTGGKPIKLAESKKMKHDEEKTAKNLLDMYDDEGNPLDETTDETTFDDSVMETQDFDTSTPKKATRDDEEEEVNVKIAEMESLKESLSECKELLDLANARVASLEEDGIKKSNEIEKFVRITNKLKEKDKHGDDSKLKKELNGCKKEIKKLNERLNENMKKIREETNLRAKAEAEGIVKDSTIAALKEVLTLQQTASQQAVAGRPTSPRGGGGRPNAGEETRDLLGLSEKWLLPQEY